MRSSRGALAVIFATAMVAGKLPAQPNRPPVDPLFQNARIALRLDDGHILIIGGGIRDIPRKIKLPEFSHHASQQPGDNTYLVTPQEMTRFTADPETKWRIGDRWKIYPGAGPPATVIIQQLAITVYCGGLGGYSAAIASFENPGAGNLVAGLRASEYLAAPGQGLAAVSSIPLIPVDTSRVWESTSAVAKLLLTHAREIVKDENWGIDPVSKEVADSARRMNQIFLNDSSLIPAARYTRWSPPGSKPLLFAEALWIGAGDLPLFGCEAVIEEGNRPSILWFDDSKAGQMRMAEFAGQTWSLYEPSAFLNAWKIGNRYFVLTYVTGYEGYEVAVMELIPEKGLVPVGLNFGAGC